MTKNLENSNSRIMPWSQTKKTTYEEKIMSEKKAIVDISAVYWRCYHVSEGEEVSAAARKTLSFVRNLYGTYGAENIVIAIDAPPYKRCDIYPEYKRSADVGVVIVPER